MRGKGIGVGLNGVMHAITLGSRAGEHVPFHVSAGGQRRQQGPVYGGDGGLQVLLQDAVELEGLASGNSQGSVAVVLGKLVAGQVLGSGHLTARHPDADHELECFFKAFTFALGANVTVILLVRTVKFQQRGGILGDRGI